MAQVRHFVNCCLQHSTYQLVLIGGDCGENRLREDVRAKLFMIEIADGQLAAVVTELVVAQFDQMDARLVLVHRVEDDLVEAEVGS